MSKHFLSRIATGVALVAMCPCLRSARARAEAEARRAEAAGRSDPADMRTASRTSAELWERPYTPDMSRLIGRSQTPDPSFPTIRPMLAKARTRGPRSLAFHGAGKSGVGSLRSGQRRLHRELHAVRFDTFRQLARSPADHAERQIHRLPLGAEHLVSPCANQRRASEECTPTWFGDTIAKWDGDTLVVDTVGFNGRTRLDTIGHPHSDKMHVIERYTRTDLGHIAYEITIDDPVTYTKPWKNIRTFTLRPDWEIMEYSCEENNKDFFEGHIKATQDPNKPQASK